METTPEVLAMAKAAVEAENAKPEPPGPLRLQLSQLFEQKGTDQ